MTREEAKRIVNAIFEELDSRNVLDILKIYADTELYQKLYETCIGKVLSEEGYSNKSNQWDPSFRDRVNTRQKEENKIQWEDGRLGHIGTDGLGLIAQYEMNGVNEKTIHLRFTFFPEPVVKLEELPELCQKIGDLIHGHLD